MKKTRKKHFKYNLILLNESTLEEVFRVRTSKLRFSLVLGLFTLISFTLLSIIIFVTPLKYMLPGFNDVSVRNTVIDESQRLDSIENVMANNDKHLVMIKNIIAGTIALDTFPEDYDSTDIDRWNKLPLTKGYYEEKFVKEYEEENAFNLNEYTEGEEDKIMIFAAPSYGSITQHFSPNEGHYGITIMTTEKTPITSPQDGHIILVNYSTTNNYTIIIQHDDGFISIYKNIIQNLHPQGTEIKAGEAIAFANSLKFELWLNGKVVNPEEYIVF